MLYSSRPDLFKTKPSKPHKFSMCGFPEKIITMFKGGFARVTCKDAATAAAAETTHAPPDLTNGRLHLDPAAIRVLMSVHRGMLSPSLLDRLTSAFASPPLSFYQPGSPSSYSSYSTLSSSSPLSFTPASSIYLPATTELDTRMRMDSDSPLESLNGVSAIRSADVLAAAGYKRAWSTDKEKVSKSSTLLISTLSLDRFFLDPMTTSSRIQERTSASSCWWLSTPGCRCLRLRY